MADPFLGEIRIFGFNFAPYQWALCNGVTLPISQYSGLYSLLGVAFGGNGKSTFQLPNLAGRMPGGSGNGPGLTPRPLGAGFGDSSVTLTQEEMPSHRHVLLDYDGPGGQSGQPASGSALSSAGLATLFGPPSNPTVPMSPVTLLPAGGGQPHQNQQPVLSLTTCIALGGVFPSFP